MATMLILRLRGPMQAWGGHTFEDYRPCELFPTRSGLVGLLAACLGIDRDDPPAQRGLNQSFRFAVRADRYTDESGHDIRSCKLTDYHTILGARRVDGKPSAYPVESRREYLCDARFTAAVAFAEQAAFGLDAFRAALARPTYTPFLGRRSCPIAEPIDGGIVEADSLIAALARTPPGRGTVYTEEPVEGAATLRVRDVPLPGRSRQFLTRTVYIHNEEDDHASH